VATGYSQKAREIKNPRACANSTESPQALTIRQEMRFDACEAGIVNRRPPQLERKKPPRSDG
jgi:hypothetical protein